MQKNKKKSQILKNKKKPISAELLDKCKRLKQQKKGINTYLKGLGFDKEGIEKIKSELSYCSKAETTQSEEPSEISWRPGIEFTAKYTYNKTDDKYIMYLRAANGQVVLTGDVVRNIKENYSNWCGNDHTINEISRNHKIPRSYLVEILRILGITHDSEPITDEQLIERDVKDVAQEILQKKKFQLYQEFKKNSWKQTEEAASKWFKFQEGAYDPFVSFLGSWHPPEHEPVKYTGPTDKEIAPKKSILVGLSDIHFGAKTSTNTSYRGKGYSTEEAMQVIKKYAENVANIVKDRNYGFESCVLASLGDILHTTGLGFTAKGTLLSHDCLKEEQFQAAFDSIVYLINTLLSLFPKVEVKSVKGNHNDFGDWVLFKALEAYYRSEPRATFDVFQTDHGLFKVKNTLFIVSHGYSAEYKAKIPKTGKARESYIANLFLSKPEQLIGVAQKVLLTADQHHLEMKEYAEFEHYMLSTAVRGDKHSESLGMNNIARQNCFVIDEQGIKEIVYCYGA